MPSSALNQARSTLSTLWAYFDGDASARDAYVRVLRGAGASAAAVSVQREDLYLSESSEQALERALHYANLMG